MNKKKIVLSLMLFTALLALVGISISGNEIKMSRGETQRIRGDNFVSVDNFLNSGKGFSMEFTFTPPNGNVTNEFCFMEDWTRLTSYLTMTFTIDGNVTAEKGKIFKVNDKFVYQLMFEDLKNYINTREGITGSETLDCIYFNPSTVQINVTNSDDITSSINLYPEAEIRDAFLPGLKFRAFTPSKKTGTQYGMIISKYEDVASCTSDYLTYLANNSLQYLDLECEPTQIKNTDPFYKVYGDGYSFQATLTNVKQENYFTEFVGIPYEKVGNVIRYGNLFKNGHTNYYETCLRVFNSDLYSSLGNKTKTEINNVIYKCEHHSLRESTANVKAYFAPSTDNIIKNRALPSELVTNASIYAAANEKESTQLVLNVNKDLQRKYYVDFEPLVNTNDETKRIEASNIEVSKQLYQNVKTNWSGGGSQAGTGWYPNNYTEPNLPLGYYPDALLPFEDAVYSKENILDNVGGNNNAILFTINVPEDTTPGNYTGKVVVRIEDEGNIVLPINLEVYNFLLPEENKIKENIIVNTGEMSALYGTTDMKSPYFIEAYDLLKEYGISGGFVPTSWWQSSDQDSYIKEVTKLAKDPTVTNYYLPNTYDLISLKADYTYKDGYKTKTKTIELNDLPVYSAKDELYSDGKTVLPGLETRLIALVENSTNEVDLLKKGLFYFPQSDEPGNNAAKLLQNILCENALRRSIDYVSSLDIFNGKAEVKKSLQNLRFIVTSFPRDLLCGGLETITNIYDCSENCSLCYCTSASEVQYRTMTGYCPTYDSYQEGISKDLGRNKLMKMIGQNGYKIWWYSCIQPISPYPSLFINAQMLRFRANKWLMYSMGLDGELYYMANRTQKYLDSTSYPLTEAQILAGEATYEGTYGDGLLIYPVRNTYSIVDPNIYYIPSLRLNNIKEGIDDYNYLSLAGELISRISDSSSRSSYQARLNELCANVSPNPVSATTHHDVLVSQRNALAELIIELINL